jgi:magnesium transporter
MYYLIKSTLTEVPREKLSSRTGPYVAVLTRSQWLIERGSFDMGIDIDPFSHRIHSTKAEVNYDSLTGSFSIPDRVDPEAEETRFAFALDEKGVVFIDDSGYAAKTVETISRTKRWRLPSLERFLYDFLEQIVAEDRDLIERYDRELDAMEDAVNRDAEDAAEDVTDRLGEIRSHIRDLRIHYEHLIDFTQELEENENNFFIPENLRYFRLFFNRVERLRSATVAIADHANQIRDIYKAHLDVKQNRIMTVLTVVTTIFMPLTLIVGWYGMNFRYMPELDSPWGYPIVIAVSLAILIGSLYFFKKKKWL